MVTNSLFVFGENAKKENTYLYVSKNLLDIKEFDKNDYIYKSSKILKYNKDLQDYLDLLNEGKVTLQDYEKLLKTNCINNDANYVREVITFEKDGNKFSIAKGNDFEEFFIGDNYTNLVYDCSNFCTVENLDDSYLIDSILRLGYFTNILQENLGQDYRDFRFLGIQEDKNNGNYFILNHNKKSLIVSEQFVKNTLDIYLDFSLDDVIEYKNNPKTNIKLDLSNKDVELAITRRNILQRFIDLKNGKQYVDNDSILDIVQLVEITKDFATSPIQGLVRLGGLMLYKYVIEEKLKDNLIGSVASEYAYRLFDGIIGNIEGNAIEFVLDSDKIDKAIKKASKGIVKEDTFQQLPIEIEKKDPNQKEVEQEKSKYGFEL